MKLAFFGLGGFIGLLLTTIIFVTMFSTLQEHIEKFCVAAYIFLFWGFLLLILRGAIV